MREYEQYIKAEEANAEIQANAENMLKSLCLWLGADFDAKDFAATEENLKRRMYKDTECGAWISFDHERVGITIGSIVEGSDAEVSASLMLWPFDREALSEAIQYVEGEADMLWHEANEA